MASDIPISIAGTPKVISITETRTGLKIVEDVKGTGKPLQITVTTQFSNRTASFTLPMTEPWKITIEESPQ